MSTTAAQNHRETKTAFQCRSCTALLDGGDLKRIYMCRQFEYRTGCPYCFGECAEVQVVVAPDGSLVLPEDCGPAGVTVAERADAARTTALDERKATR